MSTVCCLLFSHKTGTLSDGIYLDLINPNEVTCNSNEACHMKFKDTVSFVRVLGRISGLWRKVKVFEEYNHCILCELLFLLGSLNVHCTGLSPFKWY